VVAWHHICGVPFFGNVQGKTTACMGKLCLLQTGCVVLFSNSLFRFFVVPCTCSCVASVWDHY